MKLSRIDIQFEVALVSQYQMSPREGHFEALYLVFHVLWKNTNKMQVMETSTPIIDESVFHYNYNWV